LRGRRSSSGGRESGGGGARGCRRAVDGIGGGGSVHIGLWRQGGHGGNCV
jgi:hypothetical protein